MTLPFNATKRRQNTSFDDICIVVGLTSSDYKWRMKKTHSVAIRMDPEVKTRLEELAKADNRSLSSYVGLLLIRHVEEQGRKSKRSSAG